MPPLTDHQIKSSLVTVPDWQIESGELVRTFLFKDFRASLAFVNKVGDLAEKPVTTPISTSATTRSASLWSPTTPAVSPKKTSTWPLPQTDSADCVHAAVLVRLRFQESPLLQVNSQIAFDVI